MGINSGIAGLKYTLTIARRAVDTVLQVTAMSVSMIALQKNLETPVSTTASLDLFVGG
jgi:hypothetical protein